MTAYVIADVTVTNPEGYAAYRPLAAASVAQHGGKFIACAWRIPNQAAIGV